MELYIGGCYQGKLDYIKDRKQITEESLIAFGEVCSEAEAFEKPVLYQLHKLIHRLLSQNKEVNAFLEELLEKNPAVAIICDEVGMGIVPFTKEDRTYRERVGRSCCLLAEKADRVERIVCGVGCRIC